MYQVILIIGVACVVTVKGLSSDTLCYNVPEVKSARAEVINLFRDIHNDILTGVTGTAISNKTDEFRKKLTEYRRIQGSHGEKRFEYKFLINDIVFKWNHRFAKDVIEYEVGNQNITHTENKDPCESHAIDQLLTKERKTMKYNPVACDRAMQRKSQAQHASSGKISQFYIDFYDYHLKNCSAMPQNSAVPVAALSVSMIIAIGISAGIIIILVIATSLYFIIKKRCMYRPEEKKTEDKDSAQPSKA